jgi:hypothetical protein
VKAENERSYAVGQRNVGESIRRSDVGGWGSCIRIELCALCRTKKFGQSLMSLEALAPVFELQF